MDNIEYKSRVGALQNALFYLKDQCDDSYHKITHLLKSNNSSGVSEEMSDEVNRIIQLFEQFTKNYDNLCELDDYTPNWK